MHSQRTLFAVSFGAFVALVCCGGSQTPPPNNITNQVDASAPVSTGEPAKDASAPAQPSMESQREPFIQACMRKMTAPDYCACAFDQFKEVFKDADLTQKPSDSQFESLKQKTLSVCAPKLTEAEVKPNFNAVCVGSEPKKNTYCDCAWTSLRKKLALADFVSDFEGPRFDDAKKTMAAACKGKLPDDVAKADFLAGCNKSAPAGSTKTCDCMWKKLRVKYSSEEVAAGVVDIKAAGLEACKTP